MVSYEPLWKTMEEREITTYALINKHNINPRTINNLRHDRGITVDTLEKLCRILSCTPNDVIKFVNEEDVI
ncbi:MAG: helix-turn-helix transcriptional regulator [Lachnospiraceae bacterium]|nr:helix-turn-helix transcriptional regulator [Lachnospiraceae bacterium]